MKYILGLALIGLLVAPHGWAQTANGANQELITVENAWKQAVVKRDTAALQRLYADEYVSTDLEGMVWTKAQDIAIDTDGVSRLASFKLDDMKVRLFGDMAIVTGRNTSKGTVVGADAKAQYRFTDVFIKRDGRWQCLATQVTPIVNN